ncbi:hypothetical protein Pmani_006679 [Petrolisthes manimaculis]|uniref:Tetratricopeptide repeat protein n=1 Tax=Petrolisthes manimaculis TaxID=1843537 RepID=A0AAE1Q9V6_9EUCA|nr:hypothetical protein Pmani_006679 [Petrolisthes manimaculis]
MARLYLLTGKVDEAATLLTTLTERHPHHLTARVHMAQVRLQQKQYWASEELLKGVLTASPGHQEALYHLSLLYATTNRTEEALAAATEAARAYIQMLVIIMQHVSNLNLYFDSNNASGIQSM